MIRTIRRALSTVVECGCGFRQTANSDARADGIARNHTCQPHQRPTTRNANRTSRND
ncbi:hypothetical protein [Streptomyces sp. MZ04]|uniref:hypothetical protein n=1 Tax=Streptomyces sp. MZ04 TaxID=2559236 RepID=UPI001432BA96|nr:hypothetical protein [Streptomyces sp. MZ04]